MNDTAPSPPPTDPAHLATLRADDGGAEHEAANRAWEIDREWLALRSQRRAWAVAAASAALAALAISALALEAPLRQVVALPIVVDKTTGETTIQQRLDIETVPMQASLDKHLLATFVRVREGYNWWWLQRDYDQVARMSTPGVFADYARQFEGDAALQKRLGGREEWRVNIIGIRLSAAGRTGNRSEATVTYDRVTHPLDRVAPDVVSRHVASVVFEYQPRILVRERDRLDNPLGFVVTAYRSDPDINNPPAPAATP